MSETELLRLFERHEQLIARCVAGELGVREFLEQYGDFPHAYALDGHEGNSDEQRLLNRHAERVRYHFGVMETLSGIALDRDAASPQFQKAARFGSDEGLKRLRQYVENNRRGWRSDG